MTSPTPDQRSRTTPSPFAATPGPLLTVCGMAGLAAVVALLPFLGDEDVSLAEQILSYVLAVIPLGILVYGLLALLDTRLSTPRLLLTGAAAGAGGALAAYLALNPLATLVVCCASILLAMLAGLLLGTALPAIALAFIAANIAPLCRSFLLKRETG